MARLFDDASSHEITVASAVVSAYPFSMACWFNTDVTNVNSTLLSIGRTGTANNFVSLRLSQVTDQVQVFIQNGGGSNNALSTGTYTANAWYHAGCRASLTSRFAYINGVPGTENTTSRAFPLSTNITSIGSRYNNTAGDFMSGMIAESAIWDVELTDAEFASLAAGYCPLLIRPANLVFYAPLIGYGSPEIDLRGGLSLTVTGATKADHPRIIYPSRPRLILPVAGGGGGGGLAKRLFGKNIVGSPLVGSRLIS